MIMIIMDAESPFNDARQARRGPPIIGKAVDDSALGEDIWNEQQLLSTEPAGAAGCPPFPQ